MLGGGASVFPDAGTSVIIGSADSDGSLSQETIKVSEMIEIAYTAAYRRLNVKDMGEYLR